MPPGACAHGLCWALHGQKLKMCDDVPGKRLPCVFPERRSDACSRLLGRKTESRCGKLRGAWRPTAGAPAHWPWGGVRPWGGRAAGAASWAHLCAAVLPGLASRQDEVLGPARRGGICVLETLSDKTCLKRFWLQAYVLFLATSGNLWLRELKTSCFLIFWERTFWGF